MSISTIKVALKTKLDALVNDAVLSGATITSIKKDPLNTDFTGVHAFLMPPAIEADVLDNRTIIRTYTFDIMVLFNAKNIEDYDDLETKVENILAKFDNDPTLGGAANAGVPPSASAPEPFRHGSRDLIMVVVQVTAREAIALTFS